MGYAGYFSTTARLKEKATPLQAALAQVDSLDTLQILEKLNYNVAVTPKELKFRRVKLSNAKIKATITHCEPAIEAMLLMGWERQEDEDGSLLVLSEKKCVTMAQVRDVQTAQQEYQKRQRDLKRSAQAAKLKENNSGKARLRAAIEKDKLERAKAP